MRAERIGRAAFEALPHLPASIPTPIEVGTRWRRRLLADTWLVGEYVSHDRAPGVRIDWRQAEVVEDLVEAAP